MIERIGERLNPFFRADEASLAHLPCRFCAFIHGNHCRPVPTEAAVYPLFTYADLAGRMLLPAGSADLLVKVGAQIRRCL